MIFSPVKLVISDVLTLGWLLICVATPPIVFCTLSYPKSFATSWVIVMFRLGLWSSDLSKSTCFWFPPVYLLALLCCCWGDLLLVSPSDAPSRKHLSSSSPTNYRLVCISQFHADWPLEVIACIACLTSVTVVSVFGTVVIVVSQINVFYYVYWHCPIEPSLFPQHSMWLEKSFSELHHTWTAPVRPS